MQGCHACGAPFSTAGGILRLGSPAGAQEDYPEAIYEVVAEAEERHFWFAARNDIILSTLRRTVGPLAGRRLLDVGCGTGFVLQALEAAGADAWGIDMHLAALERARARVRGPLVWSAAARLPFLEDFDVVSLFDVVEHAADDASVLAEARRVLRAGGAVVVTVPAGQHLWTRYDGVIGHKRRYTRESLAAAFTRAGLHVAAMQYFNCLPAVLQRLQRRVAGIDAETGDAVTIVRRALAPPPAAVNALLRHVLRLEAPLGRLPFVTGASLIAVGYTWQPPRSAIGS
jgi:SAM-dependent methyltransferase